MTAPLTRNIYGQFNKPDGSPDAGLVLFFYLDMRTWVDTTVIVNETIIGVVDATGALSVDLFVNSTGSISTSYQVVAEWVFPPIVKTFTLTPGAPLNIIPILFTVPVPTAPSGVGLNAISSAEIDATIATVSGALSYNLYRRTGASGPFTQIATGLTTFPYMDTSGLVASTLYNYYGTAVNVAGESLPSPTASVTTPAISVPATPVLSATAASLDVHLTTTATARATGYQIWRKLESDGTYAQVDGSPVTVSSGAALDFHDTTVASGHTYFYKVLATDVSGSSPFSNEVSIEAVQNFNLLPGIAFNFQSDAITGKVDGDATEWPDSSSNARNATNATSANRPIYKTNVTPTGLPALRFDGSKLLATTSFFTSGFDTAFTFFIVGQNSDQTSTRVMSGVSDQHFWAGWIISSGLAYTFNHSQLSLTNTTFGQADETGYVVMGFRYDGSTRTARYVSLTRDLNVSGACTGNLALSAQLEIGALSTASFDWEGDLCAEVGCQTALSDDLFQTTLDSLSLKYLGVDPHTIVGPVLIVYDGNSFTAGVGATAPSFFYPAQTNTLLTSDGKHFDSNNFGVSGQTTRDMIADENSQVIALYDVHRAACVLVFQEIGNDYIAYKNAGADDTSAAIGSYNDAVTYCAAAKSVGYKVVACTTTHRTEGGGVPAGFNAGMDLINATMITNQAGFCDIIADVAAAPQLADTTNLTYYQPDGTHFTNAGYAVWAAVVKPQIETVGF